MPRCLRVHVESEASLSTLIDMIPILITMISIWRARVLPSHEFLERENHVDQKEIM